MKRVRNILLLLPVVFGIVVFWLMPGINKAETSEYTRRYEDTWQKDAAYSGTKGDTTRPAKKTAYRKETIDTKKSKKVNMKMFSRAIQFEPVEKMDTLEVVQVVEKPNSKIASESDLHKAHSKK
jgi:hypothetical protein